MSAKYDRGLYDADDVLKAYNDGYHDAAQKISGVIRLCCPYCSTCLSTRKQQLERKLILFLHPHCCPYCERDVIPSVTIGTT
jgi:hypothetical protein